MPAFSLWGPVPSQGDLCVNCRQRPKYTEQGKGPHPYCGRTCARLHAERGAQSRYQPHRPRGGASGSYGSNPARIGKGSLHTPYSRDLEPHGTTFIKVSSFWSRQWCGGGRPRIEKILEVVLPSRHQTKQNAYRDELRKSGGFEEYQTFHSSQCICDLGVKDTNLCDWKSCGICNIIKSSFRQLACGETFYNGRQGHGIYSHRNPALADRFATSSTSSPYRVMIACDTALPTAQKVRGSFVGGQSQSDEVVFVDNPDSMVPSYVILYTL
ncbi:hypothetical protein JAAARDRAFT_180672 [Jaapia argillacea MUCL 33604]|uniref:PARP catalytic domain-containing protein n=1 Tax=Jaapia argillacea MUCL 33604 TaxID=933084 RepID=A0A067PLP2_9AGAM|nr:hypothetical protein JAAARDRAFT_180672 [Jaapia argillacea MUCL 33604]